MKNIIQIQTTLLLVFFLSLPFALLSQETDENKKVTVKTVKEVDGKKIVKDTTFFVESEGDVKMVVNKFTAAAEGDTSTNIMVDVVVNSDKELEWETENGKKVVIIKKGHKEGYSDDKRVKKVIVIDGDGTEEDLLFYPGREDEHIMIFNSEDGDEENIVMVSPSGKHKVIKWSGENGEEFKFDFDVDLDIENFHEDMARLNEEMKNMQFEFLDEEGNMLREIIELETLKELEHLEELKQVENMEVIMLPSKYHPHGTYNDFTWHSKKDMEVSDIELRDAGIKNQPDRLELEEIDIENEDGIIDLSFSLAEEGSPKVAVYNVYGEKVFSGKPEIMNNKYEIKMDLSKKQFGTYYLQVVSGKSSKTLRLEL